MARIIPLALFMPILGTCCVVTLMLGAGSRRVCGPRDTANGLAQRSSEVSWPPLSWLSR